MPKHKHLTIQNNNKPLFYALLTLVILLPVPLGSNRPWAWGLFECSIFILFCYWLWNSSTERLKNHQSSKPFLSTIIPISLVPFFITLQIIPTDLIPLAQSMSLDKELTRVSGLLSLSYALTFILLLQIINTKERLQVLVLSIFCVGVAEAFFGGLYTLVSDGSHAASGTYINRNHFAGFLEMTASLGLGLLIAKQKEVSGWRQWVVGLIDNLLSRKIMIRLGLAIMVIGIVLTRSRMGNIAFFSSMCITGLLALLISKQLNRGTIFLLCSLIVIDIAIVGTFFGIDKVAQRIEQSNTKTEIRADINANSLEILADYPIFGTGAGSYYGVFPQYRTQKDAYFIDHAHNDYLEFLTELGFIGSSLLAIFVLMSITNAIRALYTRKSRFMKGMAFGSLMGIISILIHSAVDFNLQIPANAVLFIVLCAIATLSLHLERR